MGQSLLKLPRGNARLPRATICIGCGCDDYHACGPDLFGDRCGWLARSRDLKVGVCSFCPQEFQRFQKGKRAWTVRAITAVQQRRRKKKRARQ